MIAPLLSLWQDNGYFVNEIDSVKKAAETLSGDYYCAVAIQSDNVDYVPILPTFIKADKVPVLILPYDDLKNEQEISEITRILIRCIIEKEDEDADEISVTGELVIEPHLRKVYVHGVEIFMTRIEFDLLSEFVHAPNRILPYEFIFSTIWNEDYLNAKHILHNAIMRLRKKFARLRAPLNIENVRGVGYRLVMPCKK
jgi:DNA-binding winged helix-turn-helix (wHTH) protein